MPKTQVVHHLWKPEHPVDKPHVRVVPTQARVDCGGGQRFKLRMVVSSDWRVVTCKKCQAARERDAVRSFVSLYNN